MAGSALQTIEVESTTVWSGASTLNGFQVFTLDTVMAG
jgi:hypothetical protein